MRLEPGQAELVDLGGPLALAQADGEHLEQAALVRPVNEVCGLIRFSRMMPSASKAFWSKWIGRPNEFVPSTTVSISAADRAADRLPR